MRERLAFFRSASSSYDAAIRLAVWPERECSDSEVRRDQNTMMSVIRSFRITCWSTLSTAMDNILEFVCGCQLQQLQSSRLMNLRLIDCARSGVAVGISPSLLLRSLSAGKLPEQRAVRRGECSLPASGGRTHGGAADFCRLDWRSFVLVGTRSVAISSDNINP